MKNAETYLNSMKFDLAEQDESGNQKYKSYDLTTPLWTKSYEIAPRGRK